MKSPSSFTSVQFRLLSVLLALTVGASQTAFAAQPQVATPASQPASTGPAINVPTGTVIPLTLVSQIKSKSTRIGDMVRARVAFPVTTNTQVAIPASTYVEGVVTSITASAKKTHQPEVQVHFTRLVFANGYVATLDAASTQASNQAPDAALPEQLSEATLPPAVGSYRTHIAFSGGEGYTSHAQTSQPTLQPLPQVGPSKGLIIGIGLGVPVALIALGIVFRHHMANGDFLLYDAGWQFQMTLSTPLTVDAAQVSAAAAIPTT